MKRIVSFLLLTAMLFSLCACQNGAGESGVGGVLGSVFGGGQEPEVVERKLSIGEIITFGEYEQDGNTENGDEPIEWIVLDKNDDAALLLSRYVLDTPSVAEDTYGGNIWIWGFSGIHEWLQIDFADKAFSDSEYDLIQTTNIETVTQYSNTDQELKDTTVSDDRVFLLSADEVEQYLSVPGVSESFMTVHCNQALNAIRKPDMEIAPDNEWALRSQSQYDCAWNASMRGGEISYNHFYSHCVRPALWMKLKPDVQVWDENDPLMLVSKRLLTPDGRKHTKHTDYTYDEFGNLNYESVYGNKTDLHYTWRYEYDASGNLLHKIQYTPSSPYDPVENIYYEYDSMGRLVHETTDAGHMYEHNFYYSYDEHGNMVRKREKGLETQQHYDATYENSYYSIATPDGTKWLKSETCRYNSGNDLLEITHFTYDSAGNLIKVINEDNSMLNVDYGIEYSYDAANNAIHELKYSIRKDGSHVFDYEYTREFDADGNLLTEHFVDGSIIDKITTNTYDAEGRLLSTTERNANEDTPYHSVEYSYYPWGGINKEVINKAGADPEEWVYIYEPQSKVIPVYYYDEEWYE